jgi:S1-C subfamily serine protease
LKERKLSFIIIIVIGTLPILVSQAYAQSPNFSEPAGRTDEIEVNKKLDNSIIQYATAYEGSLIESVTLPSVIDKVSNSVVGIVIPSIAEAISGANPTFDGSGFVYDKEGKVSHIVTNEHVVSGFEEEPLYVYFQDGSRYTASVIGTDPIADIAVLEIIWNASKPLQPLTMGNSSNLRVGEEVIAMGNPFITESYANLVTKGIISKLGVEAETGDDFEGSTRILDAIVTDTVIDDGSSGGPLINNQGQVIGMTTAADDNQCCAYAVSSNAISRIVPVLIEEQEYIHPSIGLIPVTLNSDPKARESIPENIQGVFVKTIEAEGPAHGVGLRGSTVNEFGEVKLGDIITAIDRKPVISADEFNAVIDQHSVGDSVNLTFYRNGTLQSVNATLEPFDPI